MKVIDTIADAARAEGIAVAFGLPDEATIHVGQALRDAGVRLVRGRHEQNVVAMADGHARATGAPSLCAVGFGPALAQVGTALMTAARRRSPVLVLTPQNDVGRGNVKEFDERRFAETVGARYVRSRGPAFAAEDLHEAFRLVRLRQGPVVLAIPHVAGLYDEVPGRWSYAPAPDVLRRPVAPDPASDLIDEVAGLLAWARKPIVVAGRGASSPAAKAALVSLAERSGALLATSLQGRGLFRGHDRDIGIVGTYGSDVTAELLAESDCIVAFGVALNVYQTGGGTLAADARIVHVDHDPSRIGAISRADVAVVADACGTAEALDRALEAAGVEPESAWSGDQRVAAATAPHDLPAALEDPDGRAALTPILRKLERLLPDDRVVIADAGDFLLYAVDEISVPDPGSWFWTTDFGSIGLGLGVGLGVALARPERPCVLLCGDGGLSMSLQELETAARERIPLKIVAFDDRAYRPEVRFMEAHGKPGDVAVFEEVDFAGVAAALGIPSRTVRAADQLDAAVADAFAHDGPALLDVKVSGLERHRTFAQTPVAAAAER